MGGGYFVENPVMFSINGDAFMTRKTKIIPKPEVVSLPDTSPNSPQSEALADSQSVAQSEPDARFPIVGIGASAGGLAAFEAFFSGMPVDTDPDMAFVLVQHLAPDHESILSDLIKRYTRMQVFDVVDGMRVMKNCAYIIPPNRDMAFLNGTLQLLEPSAPRGMRLPIDFFFRSLAHDQHERAICIVLSGTGSDGTLGVRAVKGEGGMAMVQDPDFADYEGMPRSAIATGLVDYVLMPAKMPAQLMAFAAHAFSKMPSTPDQPPKSENTLKKICVLLRDYTGHDFSGYKQNTLLRRVERRMAVQQVESMEDYLRYLQNNSTEGQALFRDLLIGVTNFFRDPEAFAVIEKQVIVNLFAGKPAGAPIRVWVCGCSTGEETYSLAILIQEHMETLNRTFKVQIFATDIDSKSIEQARAGVYPASIAADLTAERLAHFFTQDADTGAYHVIKPIRDLLVFSEQDVIKDPPFSKIDLISCRNLLIYLNGDLQKKLIPLFHYSLNPNGVLFLGTSETVGEFVSLFAPLDRKQRIYIRQPDNAGVSRPILGGFVPPLTESVERGSSLPVVYENSGRFDLRELTEQTLLAHYARAAVLVKSRGEILHIFGRTGKFLEPSSGEAVMNILSMAREGLRPALTTALRKVVTQKEPISVADLRVRTNGDFVGVNISLRPAVDATGSIQQNLFLVILEERATPIVQPGTQLPALSGDAGVLAAEERKHILALEQELRTKEEYLQTTLEEMDTSNEELKSTNEEMQSVNEELQSTNEELETSKEELQSVNEELATVNSELQSKVSDLLQVNNDMNNLLAGTGVATIFVDHQLRILRFTPTATELINLIPSDIGRPVAHIVSNLVGYDRLVEDVQAVLGDLSPREAEVRTSNGAYFLMRIRPYRTMEMSSKAQ
jgi:two-component system CheB/CheR fusion protein